MINYKLELYNYLKENTETIATKWIEKIKNDNILPFDSIYFDEAHHNQFWMDLQQIVQAIISYLLDDKTEYKRLVEEWSVAIAKTRLSSETPVFEVIHVLNETRAIFMQFIKRFLENKKEIKPQTALDLTEQVQIAFNELIERFAKMYQLLMQSHLEKQQILIAELGAPIIPITENIAILPLIGDIDTHRARKIKESVPKRCALAKIEKLYIDMSDSPILDTMVAGELFELMNILELLGIKSMFSGIRPEVAQTAVQAGINFKNVQSYNSLFAALRHDDIL
ncbi:STAS domain-containing protein [Listeria sp. PSOL-1]|uniref:STAS domain-containing protein n=1 Tax=Listeria sp. PSOL-1 TaxID=1844999 RepID=UPI0013D47B52|nr:STAS domain-containing protein [Listeria sp. PSOL-1]